MPTLGDLRTQASAHGVDLIGVAGAAAVDERLQPGRRIVHIHPDMTRVLVLARHVPNGISWAKHPGTKQFAGSRALKLLGETAVSLAGAIEAHGALAMPLSPVGIDFGSSDARELTPAGQGSWLARVAACEAGLGTLGLNNMLLTPQFGPRVHLGVVLTNADLPAGRPLDGELCLGLEACGRCAAVCPQRAIPWEAPAGAPLASYRGLDGAACMRSAQPFAADAFVAHLRAMFAAGDREAVAKLVRFRTTGELWQEATFLKEGAYTACMRCEDVCPVGADYETIKRSPHRQADLAGWEGPRREAGMVTVSRR